MCKRPVLKKNKTKPSTVHSGYFFPSVVSSHAYFFALLLMDVFQIHPRCMYQFSRIAMPYNDNCGHKLPLTLPSCLRGMVGLVLPFAITHNASSDVCECCAMSTGLRADTWLQFSGERPMSRRSYFCLPNSQHNA